MCLRISLIGGVPPPLGGISIYTKQLAEKLAEYGVHVEIIDITGVKKKFKYRGITLILVKSWHTREFVSALLKSQAEIFHVHVSTYRVDPLLLITALIGRLRKKKFMITILGGGFVPLMERPIHRKFLRLIVLNIADGIITIDELQHKKALEVVSPKRRKTVNFIAPPIDTDRFNPKVDGTTIKKKHNINNDQNLVVFGPHLEVIYAPEQFIKAASKVIEKRPNTTFMLLGDGTLRRKLEQILKEATLEKNVIFCGIVPFKDVSKYYAVCNVYCNPCILGQGISTFEAMACGKPVIGSRAKNQIRIRDKIDGLLFELGDEEDFAEKINWLLEHPEERKRMGANGRKKIEKFHKLEKQAEKHIDIYNKILTKEI